VSGDVEDLGPVPRDRAERRRLVWLLLRRGDIGSALLEESRSVGASDETTPEADAAPTVPDD